MMFVSKILVFFSLISISLAEENTNPHILPRPLIIEYKENSENRFRETNKDIELYCTSWRFAAEANNLNKWKTIPEECKEYVKDYMMRRGYSMDLDRVSNESSIFAKSVEVEGDGKDVWIFDIDETLLSNLPYYQQHGYGLELFDPLEFDKWVEKPEAPAISSSLRLYEEIMSLGFKIFLLTGRSEKHRTVTETNLINQGFLKWDKLILRSSEDHKKTAIVYKSDKRSDMVRQGYRIIGNSGDQWSDLLGSATAIRSFKLPNPMYYIP